MSYPSYSALTISLGSVSKRFSTLSEILIFFLGSEAGSFSLTLCDDDDDDPDDDDDDDDDDDPDGCDLIWLEWWLSGEFPSLLRCMKVSV